MTRLPERARFLDEEALRGAQFSSPKAAVQRRQIHMMEDAIDPEALVDLAFDMKLDFWDVAIILHLIEEAQEKISYRRSFSLDSFTRKQSEDHFRFSQDEIVALCNTLHMPDEMTAANRTSASGLEVLCIVLKRLSYPCRYVDLSQFFSRPPTEICLLFHLGVSFIHTNFHNRLTSLNQPWLTTPKLLQFCAAISAQGAPLANCWGFIDGTVRKICKPAQLQREVYNGHKRVHSLKFQSVVTPNGLIANLFGPMPGRRHDAALLTASGLLDHLEAHMNVNGRPLCLYGDSAYPLRPHLVRPHRGANLTAQQEQFNKDMSKERCSVEWEFGKVTTLWAFLDFEKNLKLFLTPVGKLYTVGVLLTNCHTCLRGSQTSEHFGLQPPTLQEYLY